MAKPDLDNGWFPYAYELDSAFSFADFSSVAQSILHFVRCQMFGKQKISVAVLPVAELVALTGRLRQNVDRALRELTDAGVLVDAGADSYRFVKDYETWTRREKARDFNSPKVPRFTDTELATIRTASTYARGQAPVSPPKKFENLNPNGFKSKPKSESKWIQGATQMDSELNPNGFRIESKWIQSHTDEARAELDTGDLDTAAAILREESKRSTTKTNAPIVEPVNRPKAATPIVNDPEKVEAVVALALDAWGADDADAVRDACKPTQFWVEDVDNAVRKALLARKGWRYASSILCGWWAETGGRRKNEPGKTRASPKPSTPAVPDYVPDPELLAAMRAAKPERHA